MQKNESTYPQPPKPCSFHFTFMWVRSAAMIGLVSLVIQLCHFSKDVVINLVLFRYVGLQRLVMNTRDSTNKVNHIPTRKSNQDFLVREDQWFSTRRINEQWCKNMCVLQFLP